MSTPITSQPPKTKSSSHQEGCFQVAVGAVIEDRSNGKILLLQRVKDDLIDPNGFEPVYGRLKQFEDPKVGLLREIEEETGLTDVQVQEQLSFWHIYRGEKSPQNEIIGLTFWCQTNQPAAIKLSEEHQAYKWVEPNKVLGLVKLAGVKKDLENCLNKLDQYRRTNLLMEREQRALADYQNLTRRINQEKIKLVRQASKEAIEALLLPLEHLSLAASQIKNPGLELVTKEFRQVLTDLGLEEFNPLDKTFDVQTMEAVERQGKGNKVLKVVKVGFLLNGKIIQHAQVIVG